MKKKLKQIRTKDLGINNEKKLAIQVKTDSNSLKRAIESHTQSKLRRLRIELAAIKKNLEWKIIEKII